MLDWSLAIVFLDRRIVAAMSATERLWANRRSTCLTQARHDLTE
jgi:hypothetical protein